MTGEQEKTAAQPEERADAERAEEGEDRDTLRHRVEESLERLVPEVVRRTLEAGLGSLSRTEGGRLRGLVTDLKIPKDVARYLLAQVDDTKNALLRVFAREVREFLEHTDLADDMRKVLTSISLEISTRVSFVPNESAPGIRPEVSATVKAAEPRRRRKGAAEG
jgi:hypothetical protein